MTSGIRIVGWFVFISWSIISLLTVFHVGDPTLRSLLRLDVSIPLTLLVFYHLIREVAWWAIHKES